ncbi:MAG: hypothetical protein R3C19_11510 [Planctomycetaceae bacterium]
MYRIIMPDGKRTKSYTRREVEKLHSKGRLPDGCEVEYRLPLAAFLAEAEQPAAEAPASAPSQHQAEPEAVAATAADVTRSPDAGDSSSGAESVHDSAVAIAAYLRETGDELLSEAPPEKMLKVLGDRQTPAIMISMEEEGIGLIADALEGKPSGKEWQTRIQANKYFNNVRMVAALIEMTRNQLVSQLR